MRLSWGYFGLLALLAATVIGTATVSGCGSAGDSLQNDGTSNGVSGVHASIAFLEEGTLTLIPGEVVEISVQTKPADRYAISFRLVGDSLDASLSHAKIVAGSDGLATVLLRASNGATAFVVRATIQDGPSAELQVAVSEDGFGQVNIVPVNKGSRTTDQWVGHVVSSTTCQAISADFPQVPDGAQTSTADAGSPLLIDAAPVGPSLAVFVRGGHYMWGCTDLNGLVAGKTTDVLVNVVNKAIDVSQVKLDLDLEFVPLAKDWDPLLAKHWSLMMTALVGSNVSEAEALLSAMNASASDPAAFDEASAANSWLQHLDAHLANIDLVLQLTQLSNIALNAQLPHITGRIDALPKGHVFTLENLGSVSAKDAGVPAEYVMSLSVAPNDVVLASAELYFMPSRYIGAALEQSALEQYKNQDDFADVLATLAQCEQLALQGFQGCDADCMVQLCRSGMSTLWQNALNASAMAQLSGKVPIKMSAAASFDDVAALTGFEGDWVGQVEVGIDTVSVTGKAIGEPPEEKPPAQ